MALPTEYDTENESIARRQKYAEMLRQQSLDPLQTNQMAGGYVVPVSPVQGIAKLLQAYQGKRGIEGAEQQRRDLMGRMDTERSTDMQALAQALRGQPARPQVMGADDQAMIADQGGQANPMTQAIPGDPNQAAMLALQSRLPDVRQMAPGLMNIAETRANRQEDKAFRGEQAQAQREFQLQQLQQRAQDARATAQERADAQRQIAQMQIDARREMAAMAAANRPQQAPVAIVGSDGKPVLVSPKDAVGKTPFNSKEATAKLPTSALRMQQEELDTIGTAIAINADLGAIAGQLATGGLDLGPIKNLASQAQNKLGLSDEKSRNFATLNSTLEKLRNDTLRLNKGVQTEGDAQRAWNELISNINDKDVVKQRIEEIQAINKRAADLRKMNVDVIRSNFGVPALDTSGYEKQPAAVGKGQSKWEVVR